MKRKHVLPVAFIAVVSLTIGAFFISKRQSQISQVSTSERVIAATVSHHPTLEADKKNITKPNPQVESKIASRLPTYVSASDKDELGIGSGESDHGTAMRPVHVPPEWLGQQSVFVKEAVENNQFVLSEDRVVGVKDEFGKFITWPGAPKRLASIYLVNPASSRQK